MTVESVGLLTVISRNVLPTAPIASNTVNEMLVKYNCYPLVYSLVLVRKGFRRGKCPASTPLGRSSYWFYGPKMCKKAFMRS